MDHFKNDILVDDRPGLSIGRKVLDSRRMGYPYLIIIGSMACQTPSLIELRVLNKSDPLYLSVSELIHYFDRVQSQSESVLNN